MREADIEKIGTQDGLVDRLRRVPRAGPLSDQRLDMLCAADTITALRAEVERLQNLATREVLKRDEMLGRVKVAEAERDRWKAAAYKDFADSVAACAERDKLREALRQIAERDEGSDPRFTDRMIARAALQGEGWR